MIRKVAFTMFPVVDSARARAFYEDVLGLKRGMAAPNGVWTEYDLPEGGCLALFENEDTKPSSTAGGSIAFEVEDLDQIVARVKAKGGVVRHEGIKGPHCRMTVIEDSEGNSIILHKLD